MDSITLKLLRKQAEGFLTDSCTIERESEVMGEFMAPRAGWNVVAQGVKSRLIKPGSQQGSAVIVAADQEVTTNHYRLILPAGTDLQPNDRVLHDGQYYSVVRLEDRLTDELYHSAILMRKSEADYR